MSSIEPKCNSYLEPCQFASQKTPVFVLGGWEKRGWPSFLVPKPAEVGSLS